MPLNVVAALFPDETRARRAIAAMLAAGELEIRDAEDAVLSLRQQRELNSHTGPWHADTKHRVAITALGARRIGG